MRGWLNARLLVCRVHGMPTQPLATEAGLRILQSGGNAVDAAIATAAVLGLTTPAMTGLGGDMFMLFYDAKSKTVKSINGSGRCAAALKPEQVRSDLTAQGGGAGVAMGHWGNATVQPDLRRDVHSITVPGAAAGWVDTVEAWGSGMPLSQILAPAIEHASNGFPVSPISALMWSNEIPALKKWTVGGHASDLLVCDATLPGGLRAPVAGELFKNPALANTMRALAEGGKEAFYNGTTAEAIVAAVQAEGGVLTEADLASHKSDFDTAMSVEYHGVELWECPPAGQGITALVAANILRNMNIGSMPHGSATHFHTMIEAIRLAFADTRYYVADPKFYDVPAEGMVAHKYGKQRAALIDPTKATADFLKGSPAVGSDTVSFQVVDGDGNAVSMVNSVYLGFGSGLVPEGCGFALQNRGANFSLDPDHPNLLASGKRPFHTIIPAMVTEQGEFLASFTNMGGFMQPQGHINILCNMVDYGMDPQAALDAPRFCIQVSTLTVSVPAPVCWPGLAAQAFRLRTT